MKVFLKSEKCGIDAVGEYNPETKALIVLKGSTVSSNISKAATFRSAKSVEKYRNQYVTNRIVTEDVIFKSSSNAANFVTGRSANGTKVWKNIDGYTISTLRINENDS